LLVREAAPRVFSREIPTVESGTLIVVAGTLLDIPRRDILLTANTVEDRFEYVMKSGRWMAFGGYPVLERILTTAPASFYKYIYLPCESASLFLDALGPESDLVDVLETFNRTKFGYALVKAADSFGLITLTDLLPMYGDVLDTDLRIADLAEPVVSLPNETSLTDAVHELFKRRIRRICISGTNSFVSDREILSFIFSPERLSFSKEFPEKMLEATLGDVGSLEAIESSPDVGAKEASAIIKPGSGACLTIDHGRSVVTPWDLVMKPFLLRHLKIGGRS